MRPDAPPEGKLAVDIWRGRESQDRSTRAVFGDEMSRGAGAREDDDSLHAGLLHQSAGGVADGVRLRESLTLWLPGCAISCLRFERDARHHLHRFKWIGPAGRFGAQHDGVGAI